MLPFFINKITAVSYTHLDVYKRQYLPLLSISDIPVSIVSIAFSESVEWQAISLA